MKFSHKLDNIRVHQTKKNQTKDKIVLYKSIATKIRSKSYIKKNK